MLAKSSSDSMLGDKVVMGVAGRWDEGMDCLVLVGLDCSF